MYDEQIELKVDSMALVFVIMHLCNVFSLIWCR